MVKTIIEANPKKEKNKCKAGSSIIRIAECFYDTIQGENYVGIPSAFLRLQYCTLSCKWCDTTEVWRKGNPYSVDELIELWNKVGLIDKLKNGQHLVLTGGSPLKQQSALSELLYKINSMYGVNPFIEIENECTLLPSNNMLSLVNRWNNSPKLKNSGMKKELRYKPQILKLLSEQPNSWFKFVVSKEEDWDEIVEDFIKPLLIKKEQIVLMPEGQTREELQKRYEWLVDLCCREGVRMTDRLHITIWNKKTGV